ncbi:hypothetical protein GBA52_026041 [Prunus armeniaca]|nr:hypothetical protein GBA52_026041 [Prunus armeniaca]
MDMSHDLLQCEIYKNKKADKPNATASNNNISLGLFLLHLSPVNSPFPNFINDHLTQSHPYHHMVETDTSTNATVEMAALPNDKPTSDTTTSASSPPAKSE